MKTTRTQGRNSRNSYGRFGEENKGYQRQDRYYHSNNRNEAGYADEDNDRYEDRYEDDQPSSHYDEDDDYNQPSSRSRYENEDQEDYEDSFEENDYEDDDEDAGRWESGRKGRRGVYEVIDREDIREIGRRGSHASYGGSSPSYRGPGQGNFSGNYGNSQYRPYGSSRTGRFTDSYSAGSPDYNDYNAGNNNDNFENEEDVDSSSDRDFNSTGGRYH